MGAKKERVRCLNATHVGTNLCVNPTHICTLHFHSAVCGTVMFTCLQNQLYYWFLQ